MTRALLSRLPLELPREDETPLISWRDQDGRPLLNLVKLTTSQEIRISTLR